MKHLGKNRDFYDESVMEEVRRENGVDDKGSGVEI